MQEFKDIAQELRARPRVTWQNGNQIERLWITQETVPTDGFPPSPEVLASVAVTAITAPSPGTTVSPGTYAFAITGPWGSTFSVVVGGTTNLQNTLALPAGTSQQGVINALFARFVQESEIQPSLTAAGALAVLKPDNTNAVTSAPSPFTTAATTAKAYTAKIPARFRKGAAHPKYQWMRLAGIEILGGDQHHWNIQAFWRADLSAMGESSALPTDVYRSWSGYEITEPNDDPAYRDVRWTFEIINPETYNRPANGTTHPWITGVELTDETRAERDGTHIVTRHYESLPGPVIWTTKNDAGTTIQTASQRIRLPDTGPSPAAPSGHFLAKRTRDSQDSTWATTILCEYQNILHASQSKSWSGDTMGVQTGETLTEAQIAAPSATTLSVKSSVEARDTNGTPKAFANSRETLSIAPGDTSTDISHKPGYRLESTAKFTAIPVPDSNAADYSNQVAVRASDGTIVAFKEQKTKAYAELRTAGTEKEQKPMVTILTTERWDTDATVNTTSGSASIQYTDPSLTIYSIKEQVAIGKERTIGVNKNVEIGYTIENTDRYSLSNSVATLIGTADIAFDDGTTVVYKVTDQRLSAQPRDIGEDRETKPMVVLTTLKSIATTPSTATTNSRSELVRTDGVTNIYRNEVTTSEGRERTVGVSKDAGPGWTMNITERYSASNTVLGYGTVDIAYDDGQSVVFGVKEMELNHQPADLGREVDKRPMVIITTDKTSATSPDVTGIAGGSSRVLKTDGRISVYEVGNVSSQGRFYTVGTTKDVEVGYSLETTVHYRQNGIVNTDLGSSSIAYNDGQTTVYEVKEVTGTVQGGPGGVEREERPMVSLSTVRSIRASGSVSTPLGSSRVIKMLGGGKAAYMVDETTPTGKYGERGTTYDSKPWGYLKSTLSYSSNGSVTGAGRSELVYDAGAVRVFSVEQHELQLASGSFQTGYSNNGFVIETINTTYSLTPVTGDFKESKMVYSSPDGKVVYQNDSYTYTAGKTVTYDTIVQVSLPPTLNYVNLNPAALKNGTFKTLVTHGITPGYRGPKKASVKKYWTDNPSIASTGSVRNFKPESVSVNGLTFEFSLGETLHGQIQLFENISPNHPVFESGNYRYTISATDPSSLTAGEEILWDVDVQPYKSGFIVTETRITI